MTDKLSSSSPPVNPPRPVRLLRTAGLPTRATETPPSLRRFPEQNEHAEMAISPWQAQTPGIGTEEPDTSTVGKLLSGEFPPAFSDQSEISLLPTVKLPITVAGAAGGDGTPAKA